MSDFAQRMVPVVVRAEVALERVLLAKTVSPQRLHAAIRYATLGAEKHARSLLAHAADALGGVSPETLDGVSYTMEMIHAHSLVHDGIPYVDDDNLRRGRPIIHRTHDEVMALLVGDAL